MVEKLIERGLDLEVKDSNGLRAISMDSMTGGKSVVRLLLDNGATLDNDDALNGRTP